MKTLFRVIFQVYAPTFTHTDKEIEEFYEQLKGNEKDSNCPKIDLIVVQGDWYAKIATDAFDHWPCKAGRYGVGETNDRGLRLLEFAITHKSYDGIRNTQVKAF